MTMSAANLFHFACSIASSLCCQNCSSTCLQCHHNSYELVAGRLGSVVAGGWWLVAGGRPFFLTCCCCCCCCWMMGGKLVQSVHSEDEEASWFNQFTLKTKTHPPRDISSSLLQSQREKAPQAVS
jgi:hypothetical protein